VENYLVLIEEIQVMNSRLPFGDPPITNSNPLDYKMIRRTDPHKPNPLNRRKTIGVKVSETAYERLRDVAESQGKTLGEWCRERILEAVEAPVPSVTDFALVAEVAATRVMLIDMLSLIGRDGRLNPQKAQEIVDKAHDEKFDEALDLLTTAHRKRKYFSWTMPPSTSNQEDQDK
jgi:predicted DNA-binding protein